MHSDACFVTGKTHPICQDYAFAGEDEHPFGVVSDGCSSSLHTDIGARLLVHAFVSEIPSFRIVQNEALMIRVATSAAGAATVLNLPIECLDATLLCCSYISLDPLAMIVGDGVVACKYEDDSIAAWHVEYDHNAPEYASYRLDPKRQERYNNEFGPLKKVTKWSTTAGFTTTTMISDFIQLLRFNLAEKPKVVAVMSDGVDTFESIPWHDVVVSLMDFKSTKGQFVQRRMKRFIKNCQKKGISPYDDVSMAAIYLGN